MHRQKSKYIFHLNTKTMNALRITEYPTTQMIVNSTEEELKIRCLNGLNLFTVKGQSNVPEVMSRYIDLIENVKTHLKNSERLNCYFYYSSINGTTIKLLFNLFKILKNACVAHKSIGVYWMVDKENEEVNDVGLEFQKLNMFKFQIINP